MRKIRIGSKIKTDMPNLQQLVGQMVMIKFSFVADPTLTKVKLVAVDHAGIWIEDRTLTDALVHPAGPLAASTTPFLFLPFCRIDAVVAFLDVSGLSGSNVQ